jgi:predicted metal-dependent HD superfamily phosphohydrolase
VLGLGVLGSDAVTVEVVVQVLDLLVAGEEHEAPRASGSGQVVVDVGLARLGGHVNRDSDLVTRDARHMVLLVVG